MVPDVPGWWSDSLAGLLKNPPSCAGAAFRGLALFHLRLRLCSLVGGNETWSLHKDGGDLTASLKAAAGESTVGTNKMERGGRGGGRSQMAWHMLCLPLPSPTTILPLISPMPQIPGLLEGVATWEGRGYWHGSGGGIPRRPLQRFCNLTS